MKRYSIALIGIMLVGITVGCTKDEDAPVQVGSTTGTSGTQNPPSTGSTTATTSKETLLQLVNAARTSGCNCGSTYMPPVKALVWNSTLEQAALAHSKDMNQKGYFSHTGSDGSSAGDRITRLGYVWSAWGENIAMGYTSEKAVVDAWLASEGHCKNIMSSMFTEMGVARDGAYWTQEFGKPR